MCSSILQLAFNILLVAGIGLTITALTTPGWVKFTPRNDTSLIAANVIEGQPIERGFFTCTAAGGANLNIFNASELESCARETFKALKDWEIATAAFLVFGLAIGLLALVWSLAVCCVLCCFKSCVSFPLPVLACLAAICDMIAVIIFGLKSNSDPPKLSVTMTWEEFEAIGYSLWIAALAAFVFFVDAIVGTFYVNLTKYNSMV